MFRRRAFSPTIALALADLPLCSDGNRIANRLATPITVQTLGHCRLAPTDRG
ncbi:MAG: hypothetical protein LBC02_02005 [Planctomycetaceae bacterium]|nr:hypothetical protein [Planctomycetaceae bacterium]